MLEQRFSQLKTIYINYKKFGTGLQPAPPPLFDLKLVYFYVIEVADSESDLGLFSTAL